jgi:hypothetical protein
MVDAINRTGSADPEAIGKAPPPPTSRATGSSALEGLKFDETGQNVYDSAILV